jgi:hypothetical protein
MKYPSSSLMLHGVTVLTVVATGLLFYFAIFTGLSVGQWLVATVLYCAIAFAALVIGRAVARRHKRD